MREPRGSDQRITRIKGLGQKNSPTAIDGAAQERSDMILKRRLG